MMRRVLAVVAVVAMVVSIAGCSDDSSSNPSITGDDSSATSASDAPTTTAAPPPPETVDEWLATTEAPTTEELLSVFALVLGDVPGATVSELDTSEVTTSRTWLVNAVTSRMSEFTPEQQAAITALVVPDLVAPTASGLRPATPPVPTGEVELQALVGDLVTELEGRTGYGYPRPTPRVVVVDRDDIEGDGTWAEALAGSDLIDTGSGVYVLDQTGPTAEMDCTIYIGTLVTSFTINVLREKLLHEVFHCFQYAYFHLDISYFAALGGWRTEGTAAWVGLESVGGGTTGVDSWWRTYLQGNTTNRGTYSLSVGNGYSAVGFWSFLAQHGVDVWHMVLPQLNQATQSQAYHFVTNDDPGLLSQWASSATQNGWSGAWSMTGAQITGDRRPAHEQAITLDSLVEATVPNLANGVVSGQVNGGVEYSIIGVAGVGIVSWDGESERTLNDQAARYCFLGEDCLCPDGSPPFGGAPYETIDPGVATVGFGSISTGSTKVLMQGFTKQDVCEQCEGVSAGGVSAGLLAFEEVNQCPDPCLNGKWVVDNGVMLSQFDNLTAGLPIISSNAEGQSVWEFDHGHLTVTYGHTFIILMQLDEVGVMEQRAAFSGPTTLDYRAVFGFFEGFNIASSSQVTSTVTIAGSSNSIVTPIESREQLGNVVYECLGNDLTVTNVDYGIVAALHRINPTE